MGMARPNEAGSSLILRSAETLGRMIGALQRQLDAVSKPRASPAHVKKTAAPSGVRTRAAAARKTTARKSTARKTTQRMKTRRQG